MGAIPIVAKIVRTMAWAQDHRGSFTTSELADAIEVHRNTASRYLRVLAVHRFIVHVEGDTDAQGVNRWRAGPRLYYEEAD